MAAVAGYHDRIAFGVDAGDDTDMAAAASAHHRDRSDLRAGDALAITREVAGQIGAGAAMAGMLQHHVHEPCAPQATAAGRIAAKIAARLGDDAGSTKAARRHRHTLGCGGGHEARLRISKAARAQLRYAAFPARCACVVAMVTNMVS